MAVFALGVVVAPVLGPTLGGWLTDILFLALGLLYQYPDRHPRRLHDLPQSWTIPHYIANAKPGPIDWLGPRASGGLARLPPDHPR